MSPNRSTARLREVKPDREKTSEINQGSQTEPSGKAEYITLSYEPSNTVAKELYASFGFEEHFKEYLKEGDEINALLKL